MNIQAYLSEKYIRSLLTMSMKAFDAPILRDVGSNCNGRQLASLIGDRCVQYGVLDNEREHCVATSYTLTEKLGFATGGNVHRPSARHLGWDEHVSILKATLSRFGLASGPGGESISSSNEMKASCV